MNIKEAKNYIKDSVTLYLKKDEFGEYRVPVVRQRPIFLLGAPGIGKTAIMEQIAEELGIALVAYSMTHHTRQSALGLPFITQKNYGGKDYSVSEYTMSEIIASIYDTMEMSGVREGILFLDEINCVSETLAPSMLQFLQYKAFGKHKVPEGWIIVTAGNPPEYNKSVREFDVVTMDRLKVLYVEPDLKVWKEYASEHRIHGAVTSFLEIHKEFFYLMEMTTRGRNYVTARGWEDISQILYLYEEEGLKADESLVEQYIRNDRVVKEFTAYYDLYNKYKRDYQISEILAGNILQSAVERARSAPFDERLSLIGMLMDKVQTDMKDVVERAEYLSGLRPFLKALKTSSSVEENGQKIKTMAEGQRKKLESAQAAGAVSEAEKKRYRRILKFLDELSKELNLSGVQSVEDAYTLAKAKYEGNVEKIKNHTEGVKAALHALFVFVETAFEEGNEMLVVLTELTVNVQSSKFIAMFGSEDYKKYSKGLMLSERKNDIREEILKLDI